MRFPRYFHLLWETWIFKTCLERKAGDSWVVKAAGNMTCAVFCKLLSNNWKHEYSLILWYNHSRHILYTLL